MHSEEFCTQREKDVLKNYRLLDEHGKEAVEATLSVESKRMDELRKQDKQENDNKILKLTPHKIPKYEFQQSIL